MQAFVISSCALTFCRPAVGASICFCCSATLLAIPSLDARWSLLVPRLRCVLRGTHCATARPLGHSVREWNPCFHIVSSDRIRVRDSARRRFPVVRHGATLLMSYPQCQESCADLSRRSTVHKSSTEHFPSEVLPLPSFYPAPLIVSHWRRCRSIFPLPVLGSESRNSICWGIMYGGNFSAQCRFNSVALTELL